MQAWKDKLFAGFTNSAAMNGDKFATIQYFWTLAMQHGGLWIGLGMLPSNDKAATRSPSTRAVSRSPLAISEELASVGEVASAPA